MSSNFFIFHRIFKLFGDFGSSVFVQSKNMWPLGTIMTPKGTCGSLKIGNFRFLLLKICKSYLSLFFSDEIIGPINLYPSLKHFRFVTSGSKFSSYYRKLNSRLSSYCRNTVLFLNLHTSVPWFGYKESLWYFRCKRSADKSNKSPFEKIIYRLDILLKPNPIIINLPWYDCVISSCGYFIFYIFTSKYRKWNKPEIRFCHFLEHKNRK